MSKSDQKIVQYLNEAHASEIALVRVLQSQIAMTPRGSYRDGLEKHLGETRDHARRIQEMERRARELPHRTRYLQLLNNLARRTLDTQRQWLDDVERELAPRQK